MSGQNAPRFIPFLLAADGSPVALGCGAGLMVVIWISFRAQPHKRAEILSVVDELVERVRETAGCTRGRLYADSEDPNSFAVVSEWHARVDAEAFMESKDFQLFRGIRMLLRGEPLIMLDEVQTRVTKSFR